MPVLLGIDRLLSSDRLRGRRVGIVCNAASVDGSFSHTADRLCAQPGITVTALFGPQHGFRADVQDNMVETDHARDNRRRIPVYSLYSETRMPTAQMLSDVDLLVVDLQDVGTRVYTFVNTMANCLRAGRAHAIPVVVCDRPNPIGGVAVEGPVLDTQYRSFVGQFPIPMRHGMTIGELALLFNEKFAIAAELDVVAMDGWERQMYHDATGLPWVMPSPNMPTLDTAIVYPGAVLFEGTNVSEGRGTTRPFELVGAPWIDGEQLAEQMNAAGAPGVHFRPVYFEPAFQKHAGRTCGGCQIHVTDRSVFEPVRTALMLLSELYRLDPVRFAWREPPYEYEQEKMPVDILAGTDALRHAIEAGTAPNVIARRWNDEVDDFIKARKPFLLYS